MSPARDRDKVRPSERLFGLFGSLLFNLAIAGLALATYYSVEPLGFDAAPSGEPIEVQLLTAPPAPSLPSPVERPKPTPKPEPTPEPTPRATPEATPEPTPESTPEPETKKTIDIPDPKPKPKATPKPTPKATPAPKPAPEPKETPKAKETPKPEPKQPPREEKKSVSKEDLERMVAERNLTPGGHKQAAAKGPSGPAASKQRGLPGSHGTNTNSVQVGPATMRNSGLPVGYINGALEHIGRYFLVPADKQGSATCTVQFNISRDGTISGIRVRSSSGDPARDAIAVKALEAAKSLSPLPDSLRKDRVTAEITFSFQQ
ncbi:TonB family protein [Candidatus Poribacteria bacterium]|nr:TonB family protein [Candidatus Poribacteria bacterium]